MNPFLQQILTFLKRLSVAQRVALGTVVFGSLIGLIALSLWAGQPEMGLLYNDLDPESAGNIVESLRSEGVAYELRGNGAAIYVPATEVSELRLRFQSEGVVQAAGPKGYGILEENTLGVTDKMWTIKTKQALEGELARTIAGMDQVELAKVLLTMPEERPFRQTQVQPTASVMLSLRGSASLSPRNVDAIANFVAGAVERLEPRDVTILDTDGNLLSDPNANDPELATTASQLELQRQKEEALRAKALDMLEDVLGPGNATVQVSVKLDFSRVVENSTIIDPESATVIAEETLQESQGDADAERSQRVRNMDLSSTTTERVNSQGDISALTVSLILNKKTTTPEADPEAEEAPAAIPVDYTAEELANFENLVKTAVGFEDTRGDRITTHQMVFDTSLRNELAQGFDQQRDKEQMNLYLRYGLMALALGLAVWLIRSASLQMTEMAEARVQRLEEEREAARVALQEAQNGVPQLGQGTESDEEELVLVDDVYTSKLSPEAQARLKAKHQMFEDIKQQVIDRPHDAAELLRVWLNNTAELEPAEL